VYFKISNVFQPNVDCFLHLAKDLIVFKNSQTSAFFNVQFIIYLDFSYVSSGFKKQIRHQTLISLRTPEKLLYFPYCYFYRILNMI